MSKLDDILFLAHHQYCTGYPATINHFKTNFTLVVILWDFRLLFKFKICLPPHRRPLCKDLLEYHSAELHLPWVENTLPPFGKPLKKVNQHF